MLLRSWCGACCSALVLLAAVLAAAVGSLPRDQLALAEPEPPGLAEAVAGGFAVSGLGAEELAALRRDGALLVRGMIRGPELLRQLRVCVEAQANMPFVETFLNQKTWLYNGAVRALLREGSIGRMMAQALGEHNHVVLAESPIWGFQPRPDAKPNVWHADSRLGGDLMLSVWIALTDGPVALQFLRGSHEHRARIEEECARLTEGSKRNFKTYSVSCVEAYQPRLEAELGAESPALMGPDLRAGDAFFFWGDTLHRGVVQTYKRTSISIRAWGRPRVNPSKCHYDHPTLYWPGGAPAAQDFACSPWALLPGLPQWTPWLPALGGNGVLRTLVWLGL